MEKERIILGIDPGSNVMGYGILSIKGNKAQMLTMGVFNIKKVKDHYLSLKEIFDQTITLIDRYLPDEMAIEAPFFGKNVQSMLKLGRAQGVAMAAGLHRSLPITEYAPLKIKMSITGNGKASKEQVADMLRRMLHIPPSEIPRELDATDALAAAFCHYLETGKPQTGDKKYRNWKEFALRNQEKIKTGMK